MQNNEPHWNRNLQAKQVDTIEQVIRESNPGRPIDDASYRSLSWEADVERNG